MRYGALAGVTTLILVACQPQVAEVPAHDFHDAATALCGGTFPGRVISDQAVDADWIKSQLTLGPVTCDGAVITMPLAVGEDVSRIWTLTRNETGVEFRHFHFEPDGSPSPVTRYGGQNAPGGTAAVQQFPADAATKENFTANGIARSNPNIWTLKLDGDTLTYSLARPAANGEPARDFRAQFDMAR